MSRTFRMKNESYRYGNPSVVADFHGQTVYQYLARFFSDQRAGRRNAPASIRHSLEKTRRARAKQATHKADDFDSIMFDPIKRDANWNYW